MNNDLMHKWIAALTSGEFKQAPGALARTDDAGAMHYCCLGVLCELSDIASRCEYDGKVIFTAPWGWPLDPGEALDAVPHEQTSEVLPVGVQKQIGMQSATGNFDPWTLPGDVLDALDAALPDWRSHVYDNVQTKRAEVSLATLNDHGAPFAVLAKVIEAKPHGLFLTVPKAVAA